VDRDACKQLRTLEKKERIRKYFDMLILHYLKSVNEHLISAEGLPVDEKIRVLKRFGIITSESHDEYFLTYTLIKELRECAWVKKEELLETLQARITKREGKNVIATTKLTLEKFLKS